MTEITGGQFRPSERTLSPNLETETRTQQLRYIAGFFDVSGSISIERNPPKKGSHSHGEGFNLRLDLERVNPEVVQLLHNVFPAYKGNRELPSKKQVNRWYCKSKKAERVIEELAPYLKLKSGHVKLVKEFKELTGIRTSEDSLGFKNQMAQLNKNPVVDRNIPLTDAYVAGVFDAHGSIFFTSGQRFDLNVNLSINNSLLSEQIAQYLDTKAVPIKDKDGLTKTYSIHLTSKKAKEKLTQLLPNLRILKALAGFGIEFQELRVHPMRGPKYAERKARQHEIATQANILIQEADRRGKKREL